jgi:putative aldouronate transport system substrate-binding protein
MNETKIVKLVKRRTDMKKRIVTLLLCASMVGSLVAIQNVYAGSDNEIVDIVMPMATLGEAPAQLDVVEEKINEITEAEIGVHVIIEPIPFGDLSSQQNLMISSGDQLDLVLALWEGGIGNYADKGAVIELDDLVEEYGQDILSSVGSGIAGGYFDGDLYAVPNAELQGHSYGFVARKDVVEELGFEFDANEIYTIEDLEALFDAYKEKYGDGYYCVAGTTSSSDFFNYLYGHADNLGNGTGGFTNGGLIDGLNKENTTVENIYASDSYMEYAQKMYEWAQKGYFSADAATNTDSGTAQVASGNYLGQFNNTEESYMAQFASAFGTEVVPITIVSPYSATGMYQAVLWGISSNCEEPEKAMQLLNMLYSNADVVTLLMYGMEGETYEIVEQGEDYKKVVDFPEGMDAMNSPYYVTLGVFGNQNLYPVWVPDTLDHYDQLTAFNEYVKDDECSSVALDYSFNSSDYSSQESAVNAVISQYSGAIACGSVNPETQIPAYVKALEDAGINDLIEANQEQLDNWLANN